MTEVAVIGTANAMAQLGNRPVVAVTPTAVAGRIRRHLVLPYSGSYAFRSQRRLLLVTRRPQQPFLFDGGSGEQLTGTSTARPSAYVRGDHKSRLQSAQVVDYWAKRSLAVTELEAPERMRPVPHQPQESLASRAASFNTLCNDSFGGRNVHPTAGSTDQRDSIPRRSESMT